MAAAELSMQGLECSFGDLAELWTLSTISYALTALQEVRDCSSHDVYQQQIWPFWLQMDLLFQDRQCAEDWLQALVDYAAVIGHAGVVPLPSAAVIVHTHMLDRLGWTHPTIAEQFIRLSALAVKMATQMQLQPVLDAREPTTHGFLVIGMPGFNSGSEGPTK